MSDVSVLTERLLDDQESMIAAEKLFTESGLSLEQALYYYFGRNYCAGSSKEKQLFKIFLINLINNDITLEVREKFNEAANIINSVRRWAVFARLERDHNWVRKLEI